MPVTLYMKSKKKIICENHFLFFILVYNVSSSEKASKEFRLGALEYALEGGKGGVRW